MPISIEKDGKNHHQLWFNAVDLDRKSVCILVRNSQLLILGDIFPLQIEEGWKYIDKGREVDARKELIILENQVIDPRSVSLEFDNSGQLILSFTSI